MQTLFCAASKQGDHVGVGAQLLHDGQFPQQVGFFALSGARFGAFDGHQPGARNAANVLSLCLPYLEQQKNNIVNFLATDAIRDIKLPN
jgi:hypothetical protein